MRRPKFSLRWLLIAVTTLAVVLACWPTVRQAVVSHQLQSAGATIEFENEKQAWFERPPKGMLDHLDNEITQIIWDKNLQKGGARLVNDDDFKKICSFPRVWNITLDDCNISDDSLAELRSLPLLTVLRLQKSDIGDKGVTYIAQNQRIENLILANSKITDRSAGEFSSLPRLYYLDLSNTKLTDNSVPELCKNTSLTFLNLRGAGITEDGINALKAALPNCKVVF